MQAFEKASSQANTWLHRDGQLPSIAWVRDTAYAGDANPATQATDPKVMATLRNIAISLLHLARITQITPIRQVISRDPAAA